MDSHHLLTHRRRGAVAAREASTSIDDAAASEGGCRIRDEEGQQRPSFRRPPKTTSVTLQGQTPFGGLT